MKTRFLSLLLFFAMLLPMISACSIDFHYFNAPEDSQREEIESDDVTGDTTFSEDSTDSPDVNNTEDSQRQEVESDDITDDTTLSESSTDSPDVDEPDDDQQEETKDDNITDNTLKLVVEGETDYVIVRAKKAHVSEATAAIELQKYIELITGVKIPVVTDDTAPVENEIVVGKTNREAEGEFNREELGTDGLIIKTNGKKLFLVGGEYRGTVYSVYEFLESYLGCRFYTGDIEKIPEQTTISLEPIVEDKQIPVFEVRDMSWSLYSYGADNNVAAKRKLNGQIVSYGDRHTLTNGGYIQYALWVHTFKDLVSYDKYYEEHPEYFTVTPDVYYSTVDVAGDNYGQLCLTNPEVLAISIDTVRNTLKSNPNASIVSISQNDNQRYCKCDECMRVWAEEGESHAGVLLRFVNAIATTLKDEFPNVKFDTLAFNYTRNVPAVTVPADNVVVRIATIECCTSHALGTCEDVKKSNNIKKSISEDIQDWGKITGNNIYVWDYSPNFYHYAVIQPNFYVLRENVRFYADNNVVGVFHEGCARSDDFEFGTLRAYLLSKLYWDPYMSEEEYNALIAEFLEYNYGAGWEYILEYINLARELSDDNHFDIGFDPVEVLFDCETVTLHEKDVLPEGLTLDMIRNYENTDFTQFWNFYTDVTEPTILTEGERLFALAYEAAETDEERERINKLSLQLTYLRSYYLYVKLSEGDDFVDKCLSLYFSERSDEFTLDEWLRFRFSVKKYVRDQVYSEYAEFNKNMLLEMLEYMEPELHINKYRIDEERISELILTNCPEDWYD